MSLKVTLSKTDLKYGSPTRKTHLSKLTEMWASETNECFPLFIPWEEPSKEIKKRVIIAWRKRIQDNSSCF